MTDINNISVSVKDVEKVIAKQGFTIIEFSLLDDDTVDSSLVIRELGLSEYALSEKGFTYADSDIRLVFVNRDLTDEEKLLVLLHEEGHILCKHYSHLPVFGESVIEESEANLFLAFVTNPSLVDKFLILMTIKKKMFMAIGVTLGCIALAAGLYEYNVRESSYHGRFFVTANGRKYHKENCLIVKNRNNVRRVTVQEVQNGLYSPCKICLP